MLPKRYSVFNSRPSKVRMIRRPNLKDHREFEARYPCRGWTRNFGRHRPLRAILPWLVQAQHQAARCSAISRFSVQYVQSSALEKSVGGPHASRTVTSCVALFHLVIMPFFAFGSDGTLSLTPHSRKIGVESCQKVVFDSIKVTLISTMLFKKLCQAKSLTSCSKIPSGKKNLRLFLNLLFWVVSIPSFKIMKGVFFVRPSFQQA